MGNMTMNAAQAWIAIIGVVFTGLTALIGVLFAALASRDARRAAETALASRVALTEIHTVVNDNFSKQREEIAAQAREIVNLRVVLAGGVMAATQAEETRKQLANEAAMQLATQTPQQAVPKIVKPGDV